MMRFVKGLLIFFAGAAAMHTASHLVLPYYITLPIQVGTYSLTEAMNAWIVAGSAIVTVLLLWLASRIKT